MKGNKVVKFLKQQFPCNRVLVKRIFKSTVHATVAFIFCLIPKVRERLGNEPAMLPLIAVIVHPGRRASATIQGAVNCITGLLFGLAYSLLGRFIAQRCLGNSWSILTEREQYHSHYQRFESALAILAIFEMAMLFFHGWMRSVSHHYFSIVFPLFLVVHFAFMAPLTESPATIAKAFSVPFYLGIAMSIFWNLLLFPEFGSTYLGNATVDALNEIHKSIDSAIEFFISIDSSDPSLLMYNVEPISLAKLLKLKESIDSKVSNCTLVLDECIYEISYSYVSPSELKNVIQNFKHLCMYISALVNACQLEFILLGREKHGNIEHDLLKIETEKEMSHADSKRLLNVLRRMKGPIYHLHKTLSKSIYIIKVALAYSHDVNLKNVQIQEIFSDEVFPSYKLKKEIPQSLDFEQYINELENAVIEFDLKFREEMIHLDENLLTPKDEMFLLSSFLMNFKETTNSVVAIMKETKNIFEIRKKQEAKGWLKGKSLWFNFLRNYEDFKKWVGGTSHSRNITESQSLNGGVIENNYRPPADMAVMRPHAEEEEVLSQQRANYVNFEHSEPNLPQTTKFTTTDSAFDVSSSSTKEKKSYAFKNRLSYWLIKSLIFCDSFYNRNREHFRFGLQVTIALMLASFPMFIPKARQWYIDIRGTWVGFVCILAMEPSVGGTFWVFFLRGVGVVIGAAWGYLSYVAGVHQTNPYLETVITIFGAVPGFYFLLGSPYVKAAIIQIISIYIVMLAAILPSNNQGSILANFGKRCLAVGYGGGIAVIVQVTLFPIKARDQLNEEISFVAGCISEMEMLVASGLEGQSLKSSLTEDRYQRSSRISQSAKSALVRATAYKGLTRQEPRLKGEYTELENVFTQIIFIQRQIIDRMDNIVLLRKQYGSAIIEELNHLVYPYRRQFVASIACLMRAVQEAIINKTPLPQFVPSARIAHRRLINKVRETLKVRYRSQIGNLRPREMVDLYQHDNASTEEGAEYEGLSMVAKRPARNSLPPHEYILKEKFLSWNASTAAMEEVIEYIEELVELTKILVGVNEFKYGFLSRPLYEDWAADAVVGFEDFVNRKKQDNQARYPSPYTHSLSSAISEGDENSSDAELEREGPVALNADARFDPDGIDLAHIASHKSKNSFEVQSLPKGFRKRVYSIGSRIAAEENLTNISKTRTLGDMDDQAIHDNSDSDEELPLALKRMISKTR